jgi:hypothetical protein
LRGGLKRLIRLWNFSTLFIPSLLRGAKQFPIGNHSAHHAELFRHLSRLVCAKHWPAQSPRAGCYFVLIQSNQKSSRQKGFFAAPAFAPQTRQNHGLESFAPLRSLIALASAKFPMPLPRTRPPLFCPLSPEAVLPTGGRKEILSIV